MRRAMQMTFVWFFAVASGLAWAGLDMTSQPIAGDSVVLLSSN